MVAAFPPRPTLRRCTAFVSQITLSRDFLANECTRLSPQLQHNIPSRSVVDRDKFMGHAIVISEYWGRRKRKPHVCTCDSVSHSTLDFCSIGNPSDLLAMTNAYANAIATSTIFGFVQTFQMQFDK